MIIEVDANIKLVLNTKDHANDLFEAMDHSRIHLSKFLPWVNFIKSSTDFIDFLKESELNAQRKIEFAFLIYLNEMPVGRIGIYYIDYVNKVGAIGYWLSENVTGKGIITKSCIKLLDFGFNTLKLNRIEIKAATDNYKSQCIPEKLNFTKEGIIRQAELLDNTYIDLVLYSMLKKDWEK
jgi:ribosomal-protein-serine acetyltransferase